MEDSIAYGAAYTKTGDVLDENRIVKAKINGSMTTGKYTVNEELYLGSLLTSSLTQITHAKDAEGNITGLSATYFCYEDSGIDILADLETQQMIEYDGRNSGWYTSVKAKYEAGELKAGEVFWTDPVLDGSGRGISVICAAPVEVNGKLAGVAGTGGTLGSFTEIVANSKVGSTGYTFMVNRGNAKVILNPNIYEEADSEVKIESFLNESKNDDLKKLAESICNGETTLTECVIDGKEVFVAYAPLENINWAMVTVVDKDDSTIIDTVTKLQSEMQEIGQESVDNISKLVVIICVILVLLVVVIFVCILHVSKHFAVSFTQPIAVLKDGAEVISSGNLEHRISLDSGDEIQELGEAFNQMAIGLKEYIENLSAVMAEKERMGAELEVAKEIQANMLPSIFPAFPERKEFDIYAMMIPAREVGGDFYDFYLVDDNHLAIVMADVSGKGVPAALFMVIAKTLLKNNVQIGNTPEKVFEKVNNLLCEGNEAGYFVTAWMGILEISTGIMTCVNAGHEAPFLKTKDGIFRKIEGESGFVLAGMEDMPYTQYQIQLNQGDILYLYTDGVSEATDSKDELFGGERLEASLNAHAECEPHDLIKSVKTDIDMFVKEIPQFDDITMLALKIKEV